MTETTQPDPQVVAWMRAWRQRNDVTGGVARPRAIRAWMDAQGYDSFAVSPYDLGDLVAACKAAERALAVADIPAGQGPASLFLAPDGHGDFDLCFKYADGHMGTADIELGTLSPTLIGAFREHLAATLPTVTPEETP